MSLYTTEGRRAYVPPPCPDCGSEETEVEWEGVMTAADTYVKRWVPGIRRCRRCKPETP